MSELDTTRGSTDYCVTTLTIRRGDLDYFIHVVRKFQCDPALGTYLDTWSQDAGATGIQIVHTLRFTELITS